MPIDRMDPYAGNTQEPMTLHRFLYAGNNPVMNVDPSGEFFDLGSLSASLNIRSILTEMQLDFGSRIVGSDPNEDEDIVDVSRVYAATIPYIGSIIKSFAKSSKLYKGKWLWRHEGSGKYGGHTLRKHVSKSDDYLLLSRNPRGHRTGSWGEEQRLYDRFDY